MRVSVLCSDADHPVNAYLQQWANQHTGVHVISIVRSKRDLQGGDILFLVSCNELLDSDHLSAFAATLVLHASDLPEGRGWSPHVWQLVAGADHIVLTLLEAEDPVDSGRIWKKVHIPVPRHALWDEIHHLLFSAELQLMDFALSALGAIKPIAQSESTARSSYRRRTPEDSRLDPERSLSDQFDLMRVCDPDRYPAFFELRGHRYRVKLEKMDET
jgi:methionyl-tRNA formyltransferase